MAANSPQVSHVLETCIYVHNLQQARKFYEEVLGLEFTSTQKDRHIFFRCGPGMVLCFLAEASQKPGQELPPHGMSGCGHVAFAVHQDELDSWHEQLARHHIPIETEFHWPQGGISLYFRDPSNNSVELATPNIWDK